MDQFGGADGGNPFVSGLVNAVNIAGAIQQQGLAREQEARAKAQEGRAAENDAQNKGRQEQVSASNDLDLQTRLTAGGIREATNQDLIDSKTGALPNKIVNFGKKQYVLPTQEQTDAKKASDFKTKLDQDTQEETAKATARDTAAEQTRIKLRKDRLATEGQKLPPEVAALLKVSPDTLYLPEEINHFAQTQKYLADANKANRPAEPKAPPATTNDNGDVTSYNPDGSVLKVNKGAGKSKTQPRDPAELLDLADRRAELRQKAADVKQQTVDGKQQGVLQQQEQTLHTQRGILGQAISAADGDLVPNPNDPKQQVKMTPAYRNLFKAQLDGAAKKVENLQNEQRQIRQKWGWGEFAPGGTGADAQQSPKTESDTQPAAATPTGATAVATPPDQGTFINPNTPKPKGMVQPGNIDLTKLPVINNPDGSWSTVNSVSFTDEKQGSPTFGKEVLVRGIVNGKKVDPEHNPADLAAVKADYYKTGKNLGVFQAGAYDDADKYAQALHSDWEKGKIKGAQMATPSPANPAAGRNEGPGPQSGGAPPARANPAQGGPPVSGTAKVLDASKPADLAIAKQYLVKANGDKTKARRLATADGYSFKQ